MPPTFGSEATKLTIDALVDLQTPQDVNISFSGDQVAYSLGARSKKLDKNFVSSIWVAEVGKLHSARQVTSGLFNDKSPKWSPDGEYIAFLSDRAKAGESSAIYLLPIKGGGEPFPLTKAENKKSIESFKWSINGKFIAFTSADEKSSEKEAKEKEKDDAQVYGEDWEYARLRCVHIATREISTLIDSNCHVNQFAWGKSSDDIVYIAHQTPANSSVYHGVEIRALRVPNKKSTLLTKFPGPIHDLVNVGHETNNDIQATYFTAGATPESICTSVALYNCSPRAENIFLKVGFGEESCAVYLRNPKVNHRVTLQVQKGLSDQVYSINHSNPGTKTILHDEMYQLSTWDIMQVDTESDTDHQETIMCFGKSEGEAPTEIFSKVGEGEIVQLSNHGSALASLHIMDVTVIYCDAKDGTKIDAVFYTPSGSEKKNLPTAMLVHGGPYYRSSTSFESSSFNWAPWLVSAGYAVLCPNYRGGSGYGEKFANAAKAGMGTKDYDDLISLLNKSISLGYVDKNRVAIGGWSQGGFLSYLAVTRPDFKFKAAICGAGVSDWDMMSCSSDVPAFEAELAGKAPWEADSKNTDARHGSPIWAMKNVKTPILILHGADDLRVPLVNAVAFHRGCLHYGIPCEFVVYPREGHPIYERAHQVDMLKRVRRFIDTHLA